MKKTNEEFNNLIELLKQALKFYASDDNYIQRTLEDPRMVELDRGNQARFALEKIKEFQEEEDSVEKEFVENLRNAIETNEDQETVLGLINKYKEETK